MTLEDLLNEADSLGLHFNNLFQDGNGLWRCNLRHKGSGECFAWAPGKSAALAVDLALKFHRAPRVIPIPPIEKDIFA